MKLSLPDLIVRCREYAKYVEDHFSDDPSVPLLRQAADALAASGTEPTREQIAKALERADAEYDEEQDLDYHLKCADAVFALFHGALFGKGLAKS